MAESQRDHARRNRLLGALETASRKRIDPHLEPIKLKLGVIVCEAGGLLKHAYFPQCHAFNGRENVPMAPYDA
jgi:hypothetical protein